jgi:hypothetical protein
MVVDQDFSERSWAAWFGEIQQILESSSWKGQAVMACHVDFSHCRWADPLPLLSLALALADFEAQGKEVGVSFPGDCLKEQEDRNSEQAKDCRARTQFLKFLAREGFLELLARRKPVAFPADLSGDRAHLRRVSLGGRPLVEEDLSELKDAWAPLIFEESTCLPARLLTLRHPTDDDGPVFLEDDDIDRWVERALDGLIAPVVADKVPAWAQGGLKHRLQLLLREALHNVAQHAYRDEGLAAIYVRYREGLLGQAPSAWGVLEEHIRREEDNRHMALLGSVPRYQGFTRTRTGFFEVYILDAGCGFVKMITADEHMKHLLDEPNPFHKAMLAVFQDGFSSKPDRATEHGGLHLLQQLLEPNKDYLRGRDEDAWWGTTLPLLETQSDSTPAGQFSLTCEASRTKKPQVRGLAWTARLSWLDPMDQVTSGSWGTWLGMSKPEHRTPLMKTLRDGSDDAGMLKHLPVQDWRLSGKTWPSTKKFQDSPAASMMVLPATDWMKNSIQDRLAEALRFGLLEQGGTLCVGEIASEEALTYLAAIRRARRLFSGVEHLPRYIVLVTRALRA